MASNAREFIIDTMNPKAHSMILNRATLVDGTFPGPLITAQKVSFRGPPNCAPALTPQVG
jgi:hypothetical protein